MTCEDCGDDFDHLVAGMHVMGLSDYPACLSCAPAQQGPDLREFPQPTPGQARCPYCDTLIDPPPARSRTCTACGETYYVRRPPDDVKRILTRAGADECEDQWAERAESYIVIGLWPSDPQQYASAQNTFWSHLAERGRGVAQHKRRSVSKSS